MFLFVFLNEVTNVTLVPEMTYNVSNGAWNTTVPYHVDSNTTQADDLLCVEWDTIWNTQQADV